jgi:hypothetical protein
MLQRETCANGSMHFDDRDDDNDDEQVIRMNWSSETLSTVIIVLISETLLLSLKAEQFDGLQRTWL